jgi:ribosylpyrimidine nucleosidase
MGGALGRGNITPSAEFNIFADPESADIVFRSGAPLVMMPLDVTTKVVLDEPKLDFLRRNDNPAVRIFSASMDYYMKTCLAYSGECPAMHDPSCIAWLLEPDMFTVENYFVQVELKGSLTYGQTVADTVGILKQPPNMRVAVDVQKERFWELLDGALQGYR